MSPQDASLSIGDVVERTGVEAATLRAWERRHGFPAPERGPSGQRCYREDDCTRIAQVLAARDAGLALPAAIARVRAAAEPPRSSIYGELRRRVPTLAPAVFSEPVMVGLSHALEDEGALAADELVVVGAFQDEDAFRRSEVRWRRLAGSACACVAIASFPRARRPRGAPAEVPLPAGTPLRHEWAVAVHGPRFAACLAAWERPPVAGAGRSFEAIWTVERDVVRLAVEIALEACPVDTRLADRIRSGLERPTGDGVDGTDAAVRLANRMLAYAVGATP